MVKELSIKKDYLLLHCCCAICALPIIEYLKRKKKKIVLYFYNPNIYPKKEYSKRFKELQKLSKIYKIKIEKGRYEHQKWLEYLKNNLKFPPDNYPENSLRCQKCFELRLTQTVKHCLKRGYKEWSTTLSVNRFKDTNFINQFAKTISEKNNLVYFQINLEANKAFQKGRELSKKYNLYRQKYCGCEFSLKK